MATDQILAINALMRSLEEPLKTYNRQLRKAWRTETDSPANLAAQKRGNAALLEIEKTVRAWVAKHPEPKTGEACGRTRSISGDEYPPCARPANHWDAYCRSADGQSYFLAIDAHQRPAVREGGAR